MMLKVLPKITCHNNSIVIILQILHIIVINIKIFMIYFAFKGSFSMHFKYEKNDKNKI